MGFPWGSASKESAFSAGDLGLIPRLGRSPERNSYPLQYSGLENSVDCIIQGVAKSRTWLSDFHFHFMKLHTRKTNSSVKKWVEDLNKYFSKEHKKMANKHTEIFFVANESSLCYVIKRVWSTMGQMHGVTLSLL